MKSNNLQLPLALTVVAFSANAQSLLSQYNVIVSGELRNISEFEGTAVISTITSGNNFNTAFKLDSSFPQTMDSVYVQTAINRSISIQQGSLYYAGSQTVTQNANQFFVGGNIINIQGYNQGATIHKPGSFNFGAVFSGVTTESTTYDGLAANSSASLTGNNLAFTVGSSLPATGGTAVFSITKSLLETSGISQIQLDLAGKNPDSVIINVTGSDGYSLTTASSANFVGDFSNKAITTKVLWNFGSASSVNFNQSWFGAVLAPGATLKDNAGALEGPVAVENLDANVEVHLPLWTGPGSIPEPSAYAWIASIGLMGFAAYRRNDASKD